MDTRTLRETLRSWIIERGTVIREALEHREQLIDDVETKSGRRDLVTNIDKETERYFRDKLKTTFPDDLILGEEGGGEQVDSLDGNVWIIDPIDGTANFVLQQNHFGIMVGRYSDGKPQFGAIYEVMSDQYFDAVIGEGIERNGEPYNLRFEDRSVEQALVAFNAGMAMKNKYQVQDFIAKTMGLRVYGSAEMEILGVLTGQLGIYGTQMLHPWDMAAGNVLATEAGLKFTQLNGEPLDLLNGSSGLIGYPTIHQQFVAFYQEQVKQ
ncbi:MAG: inositol monophosphatase family protein [Aerococcus sp.]|nr:inositol monophosphatase family protein [Aerococcus sp.]